MNFSFIHAADLHLDSPLLGLARKSAEYAERVENASRTAFDNMVDLAVENNCPFIVIAGDLFDGQWKNYETGTFFANRMGRLRDAGIEVFVVLGNHDAENHFVRRLKLSENVHLLSHREAESITADGLDVAVHGQSFPKRDVTENLASEYPPPHTDNLNIGLLHTACNGRDGHASYAPCTIEQLANHGYDYWALGHVHAHEVLHREPYIVFPGNLQGRHTREIGPKGVVLVKVVDGTVNEVRHEAVDVLRWDVQDVDLDGVTDKDSVYDNVRAAIAASHSTVDGRALALRLRLFGQTQLHGELKIDLRSLREEIETVAADVDGEIWIEKVELLTSTKPVEAGMDPTIAGKLREIIHELGGQDCVRQFLDDRIKEIRTKVPAGAHIDELLDSIREDMPRRSVDLALALLESKEE